ncbi:hypothetical protein [Rubrimonas cliftonensis]|uniref:DUF2497 domain-containing protein n=1 Tax=Rubrimonas cliftonensis TaxID=89524 RepID=A0A1H3W5R3_9RHOB|nr:hypothetical protein [Rubrimonas cliftonensis]SDZ81712.1 hypothetical protein SAMN05444370_101498 [Rubrimonas cliftonensis]
MSDQTPRDDAAMADILASIRRIVTDEQRQGGTGRRAASDGDLLELTPEMRIDGGSRAPADRQPRAQPLTPNPDLTPPTPRHGPAPAAAADHAAAPAPGADAPGRAAVRPAASEPVVGKPRVDGPARPEAPSPGAGAAMGEDAPELPGGFPIDEAVVADIARAVMREEFSGAFGRNLTQQIRQLISAEVSRALAAERRTRE